MKITKKKVAEVIFLSILGLMIGFCLFLLVMAIVTAPMIGKILMIGLTLIGLFTWAAINL